MQSCQLSPVHHQRGLAASTHNGTVGKSQAPAVKFCLALGESPDTSVSSLSSLTIADEAATVTPSIGFLEPPRPVTMTTCCQAERKPSEDLQRQLSEVNKQQTRVYCENSLARFRPPTRRTLSFPPPPGCSIVVLPILVEPPQEQLESPCPSASDQADAVTTPITFTASPAGSRSPTPSLTPSHSGQKNRRCVVDPRRRRVRFADALGFELTSVRVVACNPEEPPVIPRHVLTALRRQMSLRAAGSNEDQEFDTSSDEDGEGAERAVGANKASQPEPLGYSTCWKPLFSTQPPTATVERRLVDQNISLESIRLETMALEATVRVKNLGPVKQVWLRLTDSSWQHHTDFNLQFVNQLFNGTVDRFCLRTCLPVSAFAAHRLEFAIGYRVDGYDAEFWDSNSGYNYAFERLPQLHRASCACY